jgi:TP901 family phage tail tape measure protein
MAVRASQLVVEVGADTDKAERGLKATDNLITRLGSNAAKVGKGFVDHFTIPLTDVASTVLNAGGAAIGVATDYQDAMNLFEASSSATEAQMAAFSKTAKALGSDLTLPGTSAGDAGLAMLELNKAGLTIDETFAAAKGTLQLSAAANIDNAKAAEINANALNSFALSGDRATMVADLLAAGANASSMEITDMADGLSMASAVFAQMQGPAVGAENALIDLSTAMAVMANAGVKGSDSGTSLKQMLLMLAGPSDKAKGLMKELAENIGVSGDIAYDANGKMRPFQEIIELTAKATADMTEEQRNAAIVQLFGADASRAAMIMMRSVGDQAKETGKDFESMRAAVTKQGAAGDVAAARMKGLSGAVQGLGSTLETAALVGIEPFLPLLESVISGTAAWVGELVEGLGPAAADTAAVLETIIGFLQTDGVPILYGLATATAAYATVATTHALPVIGQLIAAHAAQALATAAAVAPYALMAAAIYGVVKAWQGFDEKVKTAAQGVLESKQWWTDSAAALDTYGASSDAVKEKFKAQADSLQALREQQQQELESLGRRMTAGMVSQAQYEQEMATLNNRAAAIRGSTDALSNMLALEMQRQAQAEGLISGVQASTAAHAEQAEMVALSAKEMEKLIKTLQEVRDESIKAFADITGSDVEFLTGLETRRATHEETMLGLIKEKAAAKTAAERQAIDEKIAEQQRGFATEEQNAALAYAQQQAAQLQHLGQQLITYVQAQAEMGRISGEKAGELTEAIQREYGIQRSIFEQTYDSAIAKIDAWATSTDTNVNHVIDSLTDLRFDTVETQRRMDELAKEYTATLVQNFRDGKIDAEQYALALAKVPTVVRTRLEIEESIQASRDRYVDRKMDEIDGKRARGGPVGAGKAYLVGEEGEEIFVPDEPGTIIPNGQTRNLLDGSGGGGMVAYINVDARGSNDERATEEAGYRGAKRAIDEMLGKTDVNKRMVWQK